MESDPTDPLAVEVEPKLEPGEELVAEFTLDSATSSGGDPLAVDTEMDVDETVVKREPVPRSPPRPLFGGKLRTYSRKRNLQRANAAKISQVGDYNTVAVKSEPEDIPDHKSISIEDTVTTATSIQSLEDFLHEEKPKTFGETGFFHIQIKSEEHAEMPSVVNDHHIVSQNTDPLNSLVLSGDLLYSCQLCDYQGASKHQLAYHTLHHCKEKHRCSKCDFSSVNKRDLYVHMRMHSTEWLFVCNVCSFATDTSRGLGIHKRLCHFVEKKHPNGSSEVEFSSNTHHSEESSSNSYTAKHTTKRTTQKFHSVKNIHRCNQCDFSSITRIALDIHLRTHLTERTDSGNIRTYERKSGKELNRLSEEKHVCEVCSSEFETSEELIRFRHVHSQDQRFNCRECSFGTNSNRSLLAHLTTHSAESPSLLAAHITESQQNKMKCSQCDFECFGQRSLDLHSRSHSNEMSYSCTICNLKYKSVAGLTKHTLQHSEKKKFKCFCGQYETFSREKLMIHRSKHFSERMRLVYSCSSRSRDMNNHSTKKRNINTNHCDGCDKKFMSNELLKNHIMKSHGLKCTKCHLYYKTKEFLLYHQEVHATEKPHQCEKCPLSFSLVENLEYHLKNHRRLSNLTCKICHACFSDIKELTSHRKSHDAENNYSCNICGKKFSSSVTLTSHKKLHPKCCDCNLICRNQQRLKFHQETHATEKPLLCDACGQAFSLKENLEFHLKSHSEETEFKCDLCNIDFGLRRALQHHQEFHATEKPYSCSTCGEVFSLVENLEFHKMYHSSNPD